MIRPPKQPPVTNGKKRESRTRPAAGLRCRRARFTSWVCGRGFMRFCKEARLETVDLLSSFKRPGGILHSCFTMKPFKETMLSRCPGQVVSRGPINVVSYSANPSNGGRSRSGLLYLVRALLLPVYLRHGQARQQFLQGIAAWQKRDQSHM